MTTKERILAFISKKGLNVYQFEMKCGLSNGYIKNMKDGSGCRNWNKF